MNCCEMHEQREHYERKRVSLRGEVVWLSGLPGTVKVPCWLKMWYRFKPASSGWMGGRERVV